MLFRSISILLLLSLTAFGQAFTPRRPFILQSAPSGPFNPTNIPGIYIWLRARDLPTGNVSTWTDVISGIIFTQTLAGEQPSKANTNSGVLFNGSQDVTNGYISTRGYHWIFFQRTADGPNYNRYLNETNNAGRGFTFFDVNSPPHNKWWYTVNGWSTHTILGALTELNVFDDYYVGEMLENPGYYTSWTNGVTVNTNLGVDVSISPNWIGRQDSVGGLKGYIYEFMIITNAVSHANIINLHNYATNLAANYYTNSP